MTDALLWAVVAILVTSFVVCALLVLTQRWHGRLSLDSDLQGAQKFHTTPVPRVGGIGLMLGFGLGIVVGHQLEGPTYATAMLLVVAAIPIFMAGVAEDITKRVTAGARLASSFLSAAIAVLLLDAHLVRVDIPVIDSVIAWTPVAIVFTCFAVGGLTNAINIVDGFNGLASGSVTIMLGGIGWLAWQSGDDLVMRLCLWGMAATVGFMLLNFPFGKIFLGDGGAYLAGFWLAECAVLLLARNPEVSTWAVLLCCIYPVWETVFSIWRKSIHRRTGMGRPDKLHFHMLVYRRLSQRWHPATAPRWQRHASTSCFIWLLVIMCQVLATITTTMLPDASLAPVVAIACFALVYGRIYQSMVIRSVSDPLSTTLSRGRPANA